MYFPSLLSVCSAGHALICLFLNYSAHCAPFLWLFWYIYIFPSHSIKAGEFNKKKTQFIYNLSRVHLWFNFREFVLAGFNSPIVAAYWIPSKVKHHQSVLCWSYSLSSICNHLQTFYFTISKREVVVWALQHLLPFSFR